MTSGSHPEVPIYFAAVAGPLDVIWFNKRAILLLFEKYRKSKSLSEMALFFHDDQQNLVLRTSNFNSMSRLVTLCKWKRTICSLCFSLLFHCHPYQTIVYVYSYFVASVSGWWMSEGRDQSAGSGSTALRMSHLSCSWLPWANTTRSLLNLTMRWLFRFSFC